MTPSEFRGEYVETLARAEWEDHNRVEMKTWDNHSWETQNKVTKATYRRSGARFADALAEVGLLPTGAEWGYGCGIAGCDADQCESTIHENAARLRRPEGGPLWLRYFTDWREVTE